MRKNIWIDNPVSDCRFTNLNRARRFVAKGRAEWILPGISIRFVDSHQHQAAQRSVDKTAREYAIASHTGVAQLIAIANLPMIRPGVLLNIGKRKGASKSIFQAAA